MKRGMGLAGAVAAFAVLGMMGGSAIAQTADDTLLLSEEGILEEGDSVLPTDNSLYDQYTFEGKEGQSVIVTLESDEFDSYVALIGPDTEVLAENDDIAPDAQTAQVEVTLPTDGTYTVFANGFDSTSRGQYKIEVVAAE
jgi:Bacterial pre-peptidase C-terminal domain